MKWGRGVRNTTLEDPDTLTPYQHCAQIWVRMATFDVYPLGTQGPSFPSRILVGRESSKVKWTIQRTGVDLCMGYRENSRRWESG